MSVAGASLVYVTLQKTAEDVAELLAKQGFEARPYHAGLDDDTRQEVQDWFMQSTSGVVVATIAFGMGVDKSNIRGIFHYNPSKSIENLAQEIGRAGRDELPALCETLLVPEDRVILENFAYADTPDIEAISKFVEILIGQPNSFFVSYYANAYETDIRETVVRTLFTFLELSEYLEATSSRYESYQFKPRVSSAEILRHFDGEHRQFASSVLAMTVKKKIWYSISLPQVANRLGCDRTRIVQLLDTFANKGWIELQTSQLVHGYRKIKPLPNNQALAQELHQYVIEREVSELSRLNELFQLMASDECLSAVLAGHFGQRLDVTCGLCSVCTGHPLHRMPDLNYPDLGDSAVTGLQRLKKQHPELLATARQQARFLCGLSSPKMIRGRLTREPLFGCCAEIPFDRVMELLLG
jgi:ATP-dependent DNA helicase RecQ